MNPTSSSITGGDGPELPDESWTGGVHGETGYAVPRRTSSGAGREVATERAKPAITVKTPFSLVSLLPPTRTVVVARDERGTRTAIRLEGPEHLGALRGVISEIRVELAPIGRLEAAELLVKLFAHYPAQAGTNMEHVAQDWLADIDGVSAKAFRHAVTSWRRSTQRFRPSPGQLLDLISEWESPLRRKLAQCLELEAMELGE